jgi:hypothetical protein
LFVSLTNVQNNGLLSGPRVWRQRANSTYRYAQLTASEIGAFNAVTAAGSATQ